MQALQQQVADKYVAALRYTDLELERVFTRLVREGLLQNTIVLVLGDHGRMSRWDARTLNGRPDISLLRC